MNIGIFSEHSLSRRHGTGVQLLRMFTEAEIPFQHFYISDFSGLSEFPKSYLLDDKWFTKWPEWIRGKYATSRLMNRVPAFGTWWRGKTFNHAKFARFVRIHKIKCDVLYLVIASERSAAASIAAVDHFKCPYVVHLMDLLDQRGIVPSEMPAFERLLKHASSVLVLTDALGDEVRKVRNEAPESVLIGVRREIERAQPPSAGHLRIVLLGSVYEGVKILAEASETIMRRWPSAEMFYAGAYGHLIPSPLRERIESRGYLRAPSAVEKLLSSCHIAFLCGPRELNAWGKFAFPSRVADFLMAGLPIIAAPGEGTATRRMLQCLEGSAVRIVDKPDQVIDAIASVTSSPEHWLEASCAARRYAEENFAIDGVRDRILAKLHEVADGHD